MPPPGDALLSSPPPSRSEDAARCPPGGAALGMLGPAVPRGMLCPPQKGLGLHLPSRYPSEGVSEAGCAELPHFPWVESELGGVILTPIWAGGGLAVPRLYPQTEHLSQGCSPHFPGPGPGAEPGGRAAPSPPPLGVQGGDEGLGTSPEAAWCGGAGRERGFLNPGVGRGALIFSCSLTPAAPPMLPLHPLPQLLPFPEPNAAEQERWSCHGLLLLL